MTTWKLSSLALAALLAGGGCSSDGDGGNGTDDGGEDQVSEWDQILADPKVAYAAVLETYLDDPRFAVQMRDFWRDAFRMGGGDLDTAPVFAAQLVIEERSQMELFTAASGACPTMDAGLGRGATAANTAGPTTIGRRNV